MRPPLGFQPLLLAGVVLTILGAAAPDSTAPADAVTAAVSVDPTLGPGWGWPLRPQPQVVTSFDAPDGPYGRGHRGVDVAGAVGQPVLAVAAGTVTFAGQVAGRGVVVVDHGRLRTTYEPVQPLLRRGAVVDRGQAVGTLGLFGSHCLPTACLHLGVRDGDVYLDPMRWLPVGPVRLLPPAPPQAWLFRALLPLLP